MSIVIVRRKARLGSDICAPHTCICGQQVESSGTHGLTCRNSAARHVRHNDANDLIKRALMSASIPAMLEPNFLCTEDCKGPDRSDSASTVVDVLYGILPVPTHWPLVI